MDLEYIDDVLDYDMSYLYYKNKAILAAPNIRKLKMAIKESIDAPNKNMKVFIVSFSKTRNKEKLFMVSCFQSTITTKLSLVDEDDDNGKIITYSKKELETRKFKLSDVVKIIKAIKNKKISFSTAKSSISEILEI